jgi:hypothetical protein
MTSQKKLRKMESRGNEGTKKELTNRNQREVPRDRMRIKATK